jgi:uncharacterized protein with HEPN domain
VSPRNWLERIHDILDAITEIQTFIHEMEFSTFESDARTIRAVELDFIILVKRPLQYQRISRINTPRFPGI